MRIKRDFKLENYKCCEGCPLNPLLRESWDCMIYGKLQQESDGTFYGKLYRHRKCIEENK